MSLRRMVPFILINIIVSAAVVLLVLYWFDSSQPEAVAEVTPLAEITAESPSLVSERSTPNAEQAVEDESAEAQAADEDGPTVHIVQAGDTLGQISQLYDVPIDDIATANELIDVNSLAVGQELLIPINGLPTPEPEPTTVPTPQSTPTPLPTEPAEDGTAIVEIVEVLGAGDLTSEAVRISNAGTRPLMLRGWELSDEDGNTYTFVDVTLYGSSDAGTPSLLIYTEAGSNGPSELYWSLESAVWEPGESVTLRDAEGTVQATYVIP